MPRRSRRRNRGGEVFNLNLTPLLDVVLQLITFFMMLIHFGTNLEGGTKEIHLPYAPAALPGLDLPLDRLVATLDARGKLVVAGNALDEKAALAWWEKEAAIRRSGQELLGGEVIELPTVVILRADRAAPYGTVRRTLGAAQQRGFAHFSLVVLRRPES
jgi:biopolymer transport protein ExbD